LLILEAKLVTDETSDELDAVAGDLLDELTFIIKPEFWLAMRFAKLLTVWEESFGLVVVVGVLALLLPAVVD
jgi:hypothetical protein